MHAIEFNTRALRVKLDHAEYSTRLAQEAIRNYLGTAEANLASNVYIDLRRDERDAKDRQDAAYLDYSREAARVLTAWRAATPGDTIETFGHLKGTLVNRGSIAGFIRLDSTTMARRINAEDVKSITPDRVS